MSYTHMPLAQRKILSARLIGLDIMRPQKLVFAQSGAERSFNELERILLSRSGDGLVSPNETALDDFLKGVASSVIEQAGPYLKSNKSHIFMPLLQQIDLGLSSVCCRSCTDRGVICKGNLEDEEIVNGGGACIRLIKNLFQVALATASTYYGKYSATYSQCRIPVINMSTRAYRKKPHDIPINFYVSGATIYHDTPETGLCSEVALDICVDRFDWPSYLVVLYVFLHECICHAYQGILTAETKRRVTEPSDPFAEGWMDWVSIMLLCDYFSDDVNQTSILAVEDLGHVKYAIRYHEARLDWDHEERSEYARNWAVGKQAAEKFLLLLTRLPETYAHPMDTFFRFSFDFNLAPYSTETRENFVYMLDRLLPLRGNAPAPVYWTSVIQIFRKYILNNNLHEFVSEILPG